MKEIRGANFISPVTDNLKNIHLTIEGKLKAVAFPDAALRWADEQMNGIKIGPKASRFVAFRNFCKTYCDQHGILPNWRRVKSLELENRVDDNAYLCREDKDRAQQEQRQRASVIHPTNFYVPSLPTSLSLQEAQRQIEAMEAWNKEHPSGKLFIEQLLGAGYFEAVCTNITRRVRYEKE